MDKKKLAAIMTAVNNYIKTEREEVSSFVLPASPSIWCSDGRRQVMSMRNLWQLRIFKKA